MKSVTPIAIVGAGPYGLSIAAHLRGHGIPFRIFGRPMFSWLNQMPKGMCLKSEGFASSLSDPEGLYTLKRFCAEQGLEYQDQSFPIPLDTMAAYGLAFQKKFAPDVEDRNVTGLVPSQESFVLTFDDGDNATARLVVVAVGIDYLRHVPQCLSDLPTEFATHSADHHDLSRFAGRDVVVVGGGASAIDLAALLHEGGAGVHLVHRRPAINFTAEPAPLPRSLMQRIRYPRNGLGSGWRSLFCAETPHLFYRLPTQFRISVAQNLIPSAAGWNMKDRTVGRVPLLLGHAPQFAEVRNGRVHMRVSNNDGNTAELVADHIIAATGYKPDFTRLSFLGEEIRSQIRAVEKAPNVSPDFQSSVPGLFFAGAITVNNFGPVVRFVAGADFTARRIARSLARTVRSRVRYSSRARAAWGLAGNRPY
jgi:thioredoxin reductase